MFRAGGLRVSWRVHVVNLALAGGALAAVVGLALLMELPSQDAVAALVVTLLGAVALAVAFGALVIPQDRAFMARVVVAGFLVRVGLALIAHASLPVGFFAPDQFTYQDVGWRTLQYLQGTGVAPRQIQGTLEVGYFYWNAFLYSLFGYAPLAPKLVNCCLGVMAGLFAYRIAGELGGQRPALNTAVLVVLFPSLILWSTQNLRDTPVVLLLTMILWLAMRIRRKPAAFHIPLALASLGLLALLRDYMAVMVMVAFLGSFVISPRQRMVANVFLGLVLFAGALLAYRELDLGAETVESASFEFLQLQRENLTYGGSAFERPVDVSSPMRSLQYLPVGLAFFLLAPFPWQVGSLLTIMTLPEMLIWYALFPLVVLGGVHLLRRKFTEVFPLVTFVILTASIYALVEGNAGTAYRHRAQLMVFLLILGSVGLQLWEEKRKKRAAPRPRRGQLSFPLRPAGNGRRKA